MVNAEGRNTEFDPRFDAVHGVVEHLDEGVHVVATPIYAVVESIAVGGEGGIVGNGQTGHWIGIKIVVDVQTIDIVTAHNVGRHITDVALVFDLPRVENDESVVGEKAIGFEPIGVVGRQFFGVFGLGAEGIDPSMQLHTATMALAHHPFEGIPTGILSLTAGKPTTPGFVAAAIEGVGFGTHLEHHGIDTGSLQHIELVGEVGLHLLARHTEELAVDALDPSTAHFALRSFKRIGGRRSKNDGQQEQKKEQYLFHYERGKARNT